MHILYLHGFRSSPASMKARLSAEYFHSHGHPFTAPQLPASPAAAMALAQSLAADVSPDQLAIIGSSLGGYYATWLAERLGCRAALLNPAVLPAEDLRAYVGPHTMFHSDEPFEFKPEYLDELSALRVEKITRPERYFLLAATGDEVLDWRTMRDHYQGAAQHIITGGDHAISAFAEYLPMVGSFCTEPLPVALRA